MTEPRIAPDSVMRPVLEAHRAVNAVMIRRRMHGPGCAMAAFVTLPEAAETYRLDPATLVAGPSAAVAEDGPEGRR